MLTLALTGNSRAEDLVSPYGTYGGYNSVIINDYLRAGEYGFRTGLSYDFGEIGLQGVSAFGNYTWGFNIEEEGGRSLEDYRFIANYAFPRAPSGAFRRCHAEHLVDKVGHEDDEPAMEKYPRCAPHGGRDDLG